MNQIVEEVFYVIKPININVKNASHMEYEGSPHINPM